MRAKCNGPAGLPSSEASKIDPMEGIEAKDTPADLKEQAPSCEFCGRSFERRRGGGSRQRFCSTKCRQNAHAGKVPSARTGDSFRRGAFMQPVEIASWPTRTSGCARWWRMARVRLWQDAAGGYAHLSTYDTERTLCFVLCALLTARHQHQAIVQRSRLLMSDMHVLNHHLQRSAAGARSLDLGMPLAPMVSNPNEAPPQTDEVYGRLPKILVDSP
jgi:hypothetical protein